MTDSVVRNIYSILPVEIDVVLASVSSNALIIVPLLLPLQFFSLFPGIDMDQVHNGVFILQECIFKEYLSLGNNYSC